MTTEAKQIIAQTKQYLEKEHGVEKDLTLERFESAGRGLRAKMLVGIGELKGVTEINDAGLMQRIYKHMKQFEVEIDVPMIENPGFDLVPDPFDSRHKNKVPWADLPLVDKAAVVLAEAIVAKQAEYDALLAEKQAKDAAKSADEDDKPKPERKKPDPKPGAKRQASKKTTEPESVAAPSDDEFLGGPMEETLSETAVTETAS